MTALRSAGWFMLMVVTALGAEPGSGAIQSVALDATRPYFIPTHPRVTTTVRFPQSISAPEGSIAVFTEDPSKHAAEYLVTWQSPDAYFTITPLKDAHLANLNVPYEGRTYVFYFYPVAEALQAAASITLTPVVGARPAAHGAEAASDLPSAVVRQTQLPPVQTVPATPARLIGMMDRLKLIHATPLGPAFASLVQSMNVEVAVSREETMAQPEAAALVSAGVVGDIPLGLNDAGLYHLVLLRAVRDPRLNSVGFICLVRNTSNHVLAFDVNSFGARTGAVYFGQRTSDATPILKPGEQASAYFVVTPSRNQPLRAANDWKLSVDLVSPQTNPGAAIASGYESKKGKS